MYLRTPFLQNSMQMQMQMQMQSSSNLHHRATSNHANNYTYSGRSFFFFVFFPAFYNLQSLPAHTTPLSTYLIMPASTLVTPVV